VVPQTAPVPTTGGPEYVLSSSEWTVIVPTTDDTGQVPGSSNMVVDAISSAGAGTPLQETPLIMAPPTTNVGASSGNKMDVLNKDGTAKGPN
jgi:hypothetical protein